MSKGYVYVLSNPSMPGLVKIGWSGNGGRHRADQLYKTGTPARFAVEFEIMSRQPQELERRVHSRLVAFRLNDGREFFSCSISLAVERIITCFMEMHATGLELVEVESTGKRRLYVPPPPLPPETAEARARTRATLEGLRASLENEVIS